MSQNFIKVFLNFPHVSSQPIKSQCLRISLKYFSIFRTFPRSQSKARVSECHFFQFFPSRPFNQIQSGVSELHQIILQTFCKFPSQPMKTESLRISSKYFLKSFLRVISTKYNWISQNLIKAFFSGFPLVSSSPTKTEFLTISCFFKFESVSASKDQLQYNVTSRPVDKWGKQW